MSAVFKPKVAARLAKKAARTDERKSDDKLRPKGKRKGKGKKPVLGGGSPPVL
jgi:hypothetical protein